MKKKWLDEQLEITFDIFNNFLEKYFITINTESNNEEYLEDLTIQKLKNLIINELKKENDKTICLTYRSLFGMLCEVYVLPNNEIDVISEIYKLVLNIYEQNTNINPLLND